MNEVTKLYENANIKAKEYCDRDSDACMNCCPEWKNRQNCWKYKSVMPPFTAEKQLELIKWLIKYDELHADFNDNEYGFSTLNYSGKYKKDFGESLASVINNELWQYLTEEERKQIKEILG